MKIPSNELNLIWLQDGDKGERGESNYVWVKYSHKESEQEIKSFRDITDDPLGAIFIGICYDNDSPVESNNPRDYKWTKIKGDQGEQGIQGEKGDNAYTVVLDNENITFVIDNVGRSIEDQNYQSKVIVYHGQDQINDYIISDDIEQPMGINVTVIDNVINISCPKDSYVRNNYGSIEIKISIGDFNFYKTLTYVAVYSSEQNLKYTWIRYANSATPSEMDMKEDSANQNYVGIAYNMSSMHPSQNYKDYEWFQMNTVGAKVLNIQNLYYKSLYSDLEDIPLPSQQVQLLDMNEHKLEVSEGNITFGLVTWSYIKYAKSPGYHLWEALRIEMDDGTVFYTTPRLSSEWEGNELIGGAQLIRNSKTLLDPRIYWF